MEKKELVQLWSEFIKEWEPKHLNDELTYIKPQFFDFMQWLKNNVS